MKLQLQNLHTIVMFCGISGSGKTTKAKQLDEQVKNKGLKSVILSSDDCREELLLDKYHHHDAEMYQMSDKAFDLLFHKMELYLKYPHNANVVIMDMMNLGREDRQKMINLSYKYCYDIIGVVLDYSNVDEYFAGLDEKYSKEIIVSQLKRFRTRTLPELGRRLYNDLIRIKSKDEPIELECNFNIDISSTRLPREKYYFVVSDVHECVSTFKDLLKKVGFNIELRVAWYATEDNQGKIEKITGREDTTIIVAGDYIDKGGYNGTKEMIEFLYNNIERILFVDANHENSVSKWLNGQYPNRVAEKLEYYSSIPILESNEELRNKFFEIRKRTVPFYESQHFIITHAGCATKYLGKTQKEALKAQRYYHTDRFTNDEDEQWLENRRANLKHLKEEAESCNPLHIFGHEPLKNNFIYKNKIHIDTGCSHDSKLTGIEINGWTGRYKLWHVTCSDMTVRADLAAEKLRELTFEEPMPELEDRDWGRLRWFAGNKINFVSGTMCPADKRKNELEDIENALDYFRNMRIDKVMLQPKYMGSRCNIYLFDEIEKSYAVTRNGNAIRKLDLTNIYKKLKERPSIKNYFKENDLELMVIDGELMPWSALGEGLIETVFQSIDKGISSEVSLLKENCFNKHLRRLTKECLESEFSKDKCTMKKEDLYKKYGAQKYEAYRILESLYVPDLDELENLHKIYNEQLKNYAKPFDPNELHYQPFSILKSVKKNGEEIYYFNSDNETLFKMVSDEKYMVCNLIPEGYEKARKFFNHITNDLNLEGVVIKPFKVDNLHCAPYMKVRSPKYLTIIYGYDYLDKVKYSKLLNQKRTRLKLRTSVEEWNLGKKLLQIKYKDISENNSKYMELMAKMIIETNKEANLDPRL